MRCSRITSLALAIAAALAGCADSDTGTASPPNPDADAQAFLRLSGDLNGPGAPVIREGLIDVIDQNGDGGWKDDATGCVLTGQYEGGLLLTCGSKEYDQAELEKLYADLVAADETVAAEKGAIQLARRFAIVSSDRDQSYADLDLASAAADTTTPQIVDVSMTLGEIVRGESVIVHHGDCWARITFADGGDPGVLGSVSQATCD